MPTFLKLLITIVISSSLLVSQVVLAKPNKGVIKVTANQVYQVQDPLQASSIDCYQKASQKLAGKFIPPNKFRLIVADINKLKQEIAKLKSSNKKSQLKKKQKALKQLKSEQERKNNLCRFTSPVIPPVPATL